jgi:hypothetical protein
VWWHTPVIPALIRLRQKDHKFKATQRDPVSKKNTEKEHIVKSSVNINYYYYYGIPIKYTFWCT